MMKGWTRVTLDNVGSLNRGKSKHRPRNAEFLYGGPYPFIQTGDVEAARFYINSYSQTYSEQGLAQSKLWPKGTLCISIVGANTGASAILGFDACFPDSVICFTPNPEKSDVKCIKYALELLRVELKSISQGAARENLSLEKLKTIKFLLPPLPTQRKIAAILSAYDDLIENNLKRIKLLEEKAQLTYEEWFVHMKFPGHESTPINEETGLPEGWMEMALGTFVDIKKGKNITKSTIRSGNVPVVAGGLLPAYYHDTPNTVNPVITVSASGANAGYTSIYLEDIWASDCSYIDQKSTKYLFFIYSLLKFNQEKIYHLQKGAAQPHVYPKDLSRLEAIIPNNSLLNDYENICQSVFGSIRSLKKQNQLLKEARDILLPRLMTGMIDVDKLDLSAFEDGDADGMLMAAEPEGSYSIKKQE